jgi:hypothetical protein
MSAGEDAADALRLHEPHRVYGCGSNAFGHDPHHMNVLRRLEPGERDRRVAIRDVRLIDAVTVELDVDRGDGIDTFVRRNHDAVRLANVWSGSQVGVLYASAQLVAIHVGREGRPWFSVTEKALGQCRSPRGRPMRAPPSCSSGRDVALLGAVDEAADIVRSLKRMRLGVMPRSA